MKKYIIAVLILFIPCVTYALTMCARDDSLVVALNPRDVDGATAAVNRYEYIWRVNFTYGTITGEATCLSDAELPEDGVPPNDISKGLNGTSPVNSDNPDLDRSRKYCFCRMTHPALSAWIHVSSYSSAEECGNCTGFCAQLPTGNRINLNTKLFNAIGR